MPYNYIYKIHARYREVVATLVVEAHISWPNFAKVFCHFRKLCLFHKISHSIYLAREHLLLLLLMNTWNIINREIKIILITKSMLHHCIHVGIYVWQLIVHKILSLIVPWTQRKRHRENARQICSLSVFVGPCTSLMHNTNLILNFF